MKYKFLDQDHRVTAAFVSEFQIALNDLAERGVITVNRRPNLEDWHSVLTPVVTRAAEIMLNCNRRKSKGEQK